MQVSEISDDVIRKLGEREAQRLIDSLRRSELEKELWLEYNESSKREERLAAITPECYEAGIFHVNESIRLLRLELGLQEEAIDESIEQEDG